MSAIMKHDMKAILGEDFFKEEVRCDYKISEAQKMIWAMELDLFFVFEEICKKYNLRYFFVYGNLIGAVRHKGFIPWDDDIDVGMPRKDYDIFMKVAPKELSKPYFLQTPYTSKNCFISNITLRNSMGTFTPKVFKSLDYNKGVPLDIFPFDYCDPTTVNSDREKIMGHIMNCFSWMKLHCPDLPQSLKEKCLKYDTSNPLKDWEEIQKIASNPQYDGSEYIMMAVVIPNYQKPPHIYKTSWFESTVLSKFENIEVPIPVGWHEILSEGYGSNYMQYPSIEERGAINEKIIVDPFTPYKDYFNHEDFRNS